MPNSRLNLLIIDDCEDDAFLVARQFRRAGYELDFERVDTAAAMEQALDARPWDALITDVNMPRFSAAAALDIYRERGQDCPFLVVSGVIGEETAVSLLKSGAHDFVLKTNLARLVPAFERERREAAVRRAHREGQEALKASEERYALAARGANDGLWDWNLRTGEIFYSDRWRDMVGAPWLEGTPVEWLGRIHPEDLELVHGMLNAHLDGRSPHFAVEYRIRHRDGGWRWMLARGVAVLDDQGIPCRMAGSQTDITASKLAEQELRRAKEDLEKAMAAKTRFLASASHDLRQPIQALFCFTSVLSMQLAGSPAEEALHELESSLGSLKTLLDSLLDVSKLDAGIVAPAFSAIPVDAVLDRTLADMAPLAREKNLRLRVVPCSATVRSDPVLLGRLLRNLIENAIRYTHKGGVVVGCRRGGGQVRIEVWDSGIGFPEAAREQIFEEFYQIGNPERDRRKGLGLGLAIVRRLSALLGHPIHLRSALGKGSVFGVTVPLAAAPREEAEVPAEPPLADRSGLVVVIDDEVLVATALAQLIRAWGFEVVVAGSVEEATERARELFAERRSPDLIVADYRLRGGRTGTEAIAGIRRLCGRSIPSVVVTGDTAADRLREVEASDALVLHKPVPAGELHRALATLIAR